MYSVIIPYPKYSAIKEEFIIIIKTKIEEEKTRDKSAVLYTLDTSSFFEYLKKAVSIP